MQYKVPQNVDIEDKVIGNLTIRQFVIVLLGVAIIGIVRLFLVGPLSFLFWPIAIVFGMIVGGIAFAKYGDQNMEVFLLSAVKTFLSPRKRVWQKEPYSIQNEKDKIQKPVEPEAPKDTRVTITEAEDNLQKLAEVVDSGGYSTLGSSDRAANFGATKVEDVATPDILAEAEKKTEEMESLLEEASKIAPKHEELVSEVASVSPSKAPEETPKILLRKDQFYKEIR